MSVPLILHVINIRAKKFDISLCSLFWEHISRWFATSDLHVYSTKHRSNACLISL